MFLALSKERLLGVVWVLPQVVGEVDSDGVVKKEELTLLCISTEPLPLFPTSPQDEASAGGAVKFPC